jgi:hypothetical protein
MKFIGFLLALLIILTGFSMLLFLGLFVGYWLTLVGLEARSAQVRLQVDWPRRIIRQNAFDRDVPRLDTKKTALKGAVFLYGKVPLVRFTRACRPT